MALGRRLGLVALNNQLSAYGGLARVPFTYSLWKLQAALQEPPIAGLEVALHEPTTADPEAVADAILGEEPDVVGFSTYVWSFPLFVAAARIIRSRRPRTTLLFGGPSAQPAMFDLPPYRDDRGVIDALCVDEGESVLRRLLEASDRSPGWLRTIPGLALPETAGWHYTPRAELLPLDSIPSAYQLGFAPERCGAILETFRGCPLWCSFCEWGAMSSAGRVWSAEFLTRELEAIKATQPTDMYLSDAGLNLNRRAFRNLVAAEKTASCLRHVPVAPSRLRLGDQPARRGVHRQHQQPPHRNRPAKLRRRGEPQAPEGLRRATVPRRRRAHARHP